jgi:hypothetical protein
VIWEDPLNSSKALDRLQHEALDRLQHSRIFALNCTVRVVSNACDV